MLDLKYRPQRLSDVLGNEGPRRVIAARIRNGTLSKKSYLLQGSKGAGKTSIARILAKSIYCEAVTEDGPCGECESCLSMDQGVLISSEEFDAATQGTVDKMRQIVEELEYGSVDGRPRVLILDEAQRLSKASQDALLRSIEDRRLVCILCTTEPQLIRTAIRSRCEEYTIHYPAPSELKVRLEKVLELEGKALPGSVLDAIVSKSECCSRVAYSLMETLLELGVTTLEEASFHLGLSPYQELLDIIRELNTGLTPQTLEKLTSLLRVEGPDFVQEQTIKLSLECEKRNLKMRPSFPVSLDGFDFPTPLRNISRKLLDRESYSASELEYMLIEPFLVDAPTPAILAPAEAPHKIRVKQKEVLAKAQAKSKTVEVDGIVFSSDEKLTGLDSQFVSQPPPAPKDPEEAPSVKLDKDRVLMSNKDFSRALRSRIRNSS